jgi:hypothetical protein
MLKKTKKWFLENENYLYTAIGVAYIAVTISVIFGLIAYIISRII